MKKVSLWTLLVTVVAGLAATIKLELLPSWLRPYVSAAYPWLVLILLALLAGTILALVWAYVVLPSRARIRAAVGAREGRKRELDADEQAIEEALRKGRKAKAKALKDSEAEKIQDPWGGVVRWSFEPRSDGAIVDFWSDDKPKFISLGFRFATALSDTKLLVDGETLRPGLQNDRAKVIVRFEVPKLKPGMLAQLQVASEGGEPIPVKPHTAIWHYP